MGVLLCDILDGSASSLAREIVDSGGTPLPSRRCHAALFLPLWCPLATVDVGVVSGKDGAARGGIGHGRAGAARGGVQAPKSPGARIGRRNGPDLSDIPSTYMEVIWPSCSAPPESRHPSSVSFSNADDRRRAVVS